MALNLTLYRALLRTHFDLQGKPGGRDMPYILRFLAATLVIFLWLTNLDVAVAHPIGTRVVGFQSDPAPISMYADNYGCQHCLERVASREEKQRELRRTQKRLKKLQRQKAEKERRRKRAERRAKQKQLEAAKRDLVRRQKQKRRAEQQEAKRRQFNTQQRKLKELQVRKV